MLPHERRELLMYAVLENGRTYYLKMMDGSEHQFVLREWFCTTEAIPIVLVDDRGYIYNWQNVSIIRKF